MELYDCIIIGAGPGGLQAAIHLARFNQKVLLIDRGGGRTRHAVHIENFLGQPLITGKELVDIGLSQLAKFGVQTIRETVTQVSKNSDDCFEVVTKDHQFLAHFVIASSGATENLPRLKNLNQFWGSHVFTCVDCDGYRTIGKKLLVMGNDINAVRVSFGMKEMFTRELTLLLTEFNPPADYLEELKREQIEVVTGKPVALFGEGSLAGVTLEDGREIGCEVVMINYGLVLNDAYLSKLPLERDGDNFKIVTDHNNQSSVDKLYAVGALRQGHAQAIIAAGQGATTAIEINSRLLGL